MEDENVNYIDRDDYIYELEGLLKGVEDREDIHEAVMAFIDQYIDPEPHDMRALLSCLEREIKNIVGDKS